MPQQDPSTAQIPAQRQPSEPAHAATLAHCGLLRRKIDTLTTALTESMVQMYTTADREYRAGQLTLDDLAAFYEECRKLGPGFSGVWSQNMSISAGAIRNYAQQAPPVASGNTRFWSGPYPYDPKRRRPINGISVVYVLYDATNEPIYVGSTAHFADRMRSHRNNGKPFTWWLAFPCESREAAYLLEGGLLAARKPPLNVKVGR